jgi:hypothetical protein
VLWLCSRRQLRRRRRAARRRQLHRPLTVPVNTTERQPKETYHARSSPARPGDVRLDIREDPRIEHPADAIIRIAATCRALPSLMKAAHVVRRVGPWSLAG